MNWRAPIRHAVVSQRLGAMVMLWWISAPVFGQDPLHFRFDGRRGQVEVGGRFAAAEFHHSRPVPSRIGFYHPAANSIDLSTDYWKRDESFPLSIVIVAGERRHVLANESWVYDLNPHGVSFRKDQEQARMSVSYEFGETLPVLVMTTSVANGGSAPLRVEIETHLSLTLRTCQNYTRLDSSSATVEGRGTMITAIFSEREARQPAVFVRNLSAKPVAWSTDGHFSERPQDGRRRDRAASDGQGIRRPSAANFRYATTLRPGDTLRVVQAIGSTEPQELAGVAQRLDRDWQNDVAAYDTRVRRPFEFETGDPWIDRTAAWSRALVEANQHEFAGSLVPMPCPAEYNFVFTHDILLSGLGIVNVDPDRVRRDLVWIADHAEGTVIPHARYWRDTSYQTEYCTPSNWNHLWFIMLTSRYVRFTQDTATGIRLLPYVDRSLHDLLTRIRPDSLVYAGRPDWWDIGEHEGPRAYLTALMSRVLDEYVAMRSSVGRGGDTLRWFEARAEGLRRALVERLWNHDAGYLLDRNGDDLDRHIFAGPLVAAVYGVLPRQLLERLVRTAGERLLAPGVGIRTVMPPDFDEDSVRRYYDIKGHEAGPPYRYINGGVWPHVNAWYAVALQAIGQTSQAREFFRTMMTIDGVASGPSGIPAMYEYRSSDPSSPGYGMIDKPSFLWAGGFNLYTVYRLVGNRDVPWNLSFDPDASAWQTFTGSWTAGGPARLSVRTEPAGSAGLVCDGIAIPSYVLPLERFGAVSIEIVRAPIAHPVLAEVNALVRRVWSDAGSNALHVECSSFDGHATTAVIRSPRTPTAALIDGRPTDVVAGDGDGWLVTFQGSSRSQILTVTF